MPNLCGCSLSVNPLGYDARLVRDLSTDSGNRRHASNFAAGFNGDSDTNKKANTDAHQGAERHVPTHDFSAPHADPQAE